MILFAVCEILHWVSLSHCIITPVNLVRTLTYLGLIDVKHYNVELPYNNWARPTHYPTDILFTTLTQSFCKQQKNKAHNNYDYWYRTKLKVHGFLVFVVNTLSPISNSKALSGSTIATVFQQDLQVIRHKYNSR